MPRFKSQVANFSAGELSPGAQDRIDSQVWQAGAERLENVLVRRGGGVRTRPGLRTAQVAGNANVVPIAEEFELFAPGGGFQYFTGGRYDPGVQFPYFYDPAWQNWRGTRGRIRGRFGEDGTVNYVRPGRPGVAFYDQLPWYVDPRVAGSAVTDPVDGAVPSDTHLPQCRYMKALWQVNTDRIAGGARAWPVGTLVMKDLRMDPLGGGAGDMSFVRFKSGQAPAGYEAGKFYPKFALIGTVAGGPLQTWHSLTGLGPYTHLTAPYVPNRDPPFLQADIDDSLYSNAFFVNTSRELPEKRVPLRVPSVLTGSELTRLGAECWLEPEGGTVADVAQAVAWFQIVMVELIGEINDQSILERGGKRSGRVQVFMGGLSARYSTTSEPQLRGTQVETTKEQTSGTQGEPTRPTGDEVRLVEWRPAPGLDYLAMFYTDGVQLTRVTAPGEPLQEAPRIRQDFSEVPLQEMVFTEAPGALYCFHETLDPPRVLRRKEDGSFAFELLLYGTVPQVDEGGTMVPYWGGGSGGIRAGVFAYGRLGLIGSSRYPNMLAFSTINEFTEFDPGTSPSADKAFHAITAGTENLHAAILGRRLVLFGERAEYFLSAQELSGRKLDFSQTSAHGSPRGGRALIVDDAIVFRQAGPEGEATDLRMMIFSDEESGFRTPSLAPFSSHLVRGVTAYAYQPSGQDGGARLWCVKDDGTMSVLSIDRAAQVNAWSRVVPPEGVSIFEVAVIANRVFVLADVFGTPTLMEMSYSNTTGSVLDLAVVVDGFTGQATGVVFPEHVRRVIRAGVPDGEPATAWCVSDGAPPFEVDVDDNGAASFRPGTDLDRLQGTRIELGLRVQWTVRTLPVVIRSATGTSVAVQKTRLVRSMVDFEVEEGDPTLLAVQRIREHETLEPARKQWPRRIAIEDSRGLWLPFITVPSADSEQLVRCKLGSRRGWKNRTTLAIRGDTPCTMVGVSFMVAGSA